MEKNLKKKNKYVILNHFAEYLNHCKSIILQLKKIQYNIVKLKNKIKLKKNNKN